MRSYEKMDTWKIREIKIHPYHSAKMFLFSGSENLVANHGLCLQHVAMFFGIYTIVILWRLNI